MVLKNGMECQNFKWILTQLVLTGIVVAIVITIAIDIQDCDKIKREWDAERERKREKTVLARWCGTQSDYQTNDVLFIIFTEKLPLLFSVINFNVFNPFFVRGGA